MLLAQDIVRINLRAWKQTLKFGLYLLIHILKLNPIKTGNLAKQVPSTLYTVTFVRKMWKHTSTGLFRVSVKSKPYSKSGVDAPILKSLKLPIVHLIRFHVVHDNPW